MISAFDCQYVKSGQPCICVLHTVQLLWKTRLFLPVEGILVEIQIFVNFVFVCCHSGPILRLVRISDGSPNLFDRRRRSILRYMNVCIPPYIIFIFIYIMWSDFRTGTSPIFGRVVVRFSD